MSPSFEIICNEPPMMSEMIPLGGAEFNFV